MDEKLKKLAEEMTDKTGKAAQRAKDKLAEQLDNENVKKTTQTAIKKTKQTSSGIAAFWRKLSKRGKIIVTIIALFVICGLFSGGKSAISGGGKITNEEQGEKIVRELHPDAKEIKFEGSPEVYSGYFNVDVGELGEKGIKDASVTRVYAYVIYYSNDMYSCWVAEDGRVVEREYTTTNTGEYRRVR